MSMNPQSLKAVKARVLGDVKKSLAESFDAEEQRIMRISFRNLDNKELQETLRHAQAVLFDIRQQASLRISKEIINLDAPQPQATQHVHAPHEGAPPVGKRLILQCLAMSDDVIANQISDPTPQHDGVCQHSGPAIADLFFDWIWSAARNRLRDENGSLSQQTRARARSPTSVRPFD